MLDSFHCCIYMYLQEDDNKKQYLIEIKSHLHLNLRHKTKEEEITKL